MLKDSAKIKCFYCGQEFQIGKMICLRGWCNHCKRRHHIIANYASAYKDRIRLTQPYKEAFKEHQRYLDYRKKLKKTLVITQNVRNPKKDELKKKKLKEASEPIVRRVDKLFKIESEKEIYWGTILSENEEIVVISKGALDTGIPVQKKFIKKVA